MGKRCPRCRRKTMRPQGKIKAGIKGGLRDVYKCSNSSCGYQALR